MAEMAGAAFASLASYGAAAAEAVSAGAAAAEAGAAASATASASAAGATASYASTAASVLQGVATAGAVLSGVMAAQQQSVSGRAALMQGEINAEAAALEGDRAATASAAKAVEMHREALRKIAAARVAFAGSGLDISSRQLAGVEDDIVSETEYAAHLERLSGAMGKSDAALHGMRYRAAGENAQLAAGVKSTAALVGAGVDGAKGLLSIAKRG